MTVICEKCGKEFALLEETDAKKAFCPYCGAQTEAVERGEISFTEEEVDPESVQRYNVATEEQRAELKTTLAELFGVKQKKLGEEEQERLRREEEEKKRKEQKRQEAVQAAKTVGKWALISLATAAVLSGLIFLFVLLFQKNDAWTAWQWIIGIVVSIVFLLVVIGFLDEGDFGIAFSMGCILTLLNALLYTIFRGGYSVLFGCFSVCAAVGSIILAVLSFKDLEEGYGIPGLIEAALTILLMIFGLIFGLAWAFWLWTIGIIVGLVMILAIIAFLGDQERRESFFDVVRAILLLLLFASPIILTIVFGIILFANREQIEIVSNFSGWCTFWVFFLIATVIYAIRWIYKLAVDADSDDGYGIGRTIVASLAVVVSIPVFICAGRLAPDFEPPKFIQIEITGKETSIGYSTYDSKISMKITNQGNVTVTYLFGEMTLYNGSSQVGVWDVYFQKEFESGQTYSMYVEFNEKDTLSIYNTSYEELGITYRITEMQFKDNYNIYEYDGETVTLKQAASTLPNDTNTGNTDTGNSGTPADGENSLLQKVQAFAGTNALLPDDYENAHYDENSEGCTVYSYYGGSSTEYSSFYVMFTVADEYFETFFDGFVAKLLDNGYTLRDNTPGAYEYVKGNTVIHFSDVCESEVWTGEEYVKEYNYFNYYAYQLS